MLRIGQDGVVTVFGTPWDGKHHLSRNMSAPLKAVAKIVRSGTNQIRQVSKAEAFPLLMKQAYSSKDPVVMTRVLGLEKQILDAVPFYVLHCNMEPEAALTAYEGIVGNRDRERE